MNPRETALLGSAAAVFSILLCQLLVRSVGQQAHLSPAQVSAGLTICLAGVVVGVLLVLCVSAFQSASSRWDRSVGAVGLALGCALLLALLVGRRHPHAPPTAHAAQDTVAFASDAVLLAPGTSR